MCNNDPYFKVRYTTFKYLLFKCKGSSGKFDKVSIFEYCT